ncbi:DUF7513 family protein [Halospeciosus flavus]|uniref:DUF7513 domain-containing protein n=2 Tax=Halospeciosus flavus TaxID=3032283 RepID=A0ABD5Z5A9_9EURY|nr:hypothetical protein [Halospeciosus flavus]
MSLLQKYLKGWQFRTHTPSFEEGEEMSVFVTGTEDGTPVARIGDTVLELHDAPSDLVDKRVVLRVTYFDETKHRGEAEYIETVGESAF